MLSRFEKEETKRVAKISSSCLFYMAEDNICHRCSLRRIAHILPIEMQMQDLSVKHIDFVVDANTCGMQHSYDSDRER